MQSNAKQCKAMQSNAKQCKAKQIIAKQCKAMQSNAKPSKAKQCIAMNAFKNAFTISLNNKQKPLIGEKHC